MEFKHGREVGTVIPDDDCYRFDSERWETYYLLMIMIDQNLHHLIKEQISDKDPERIYRELLNHFAGHKQHHIAHAKQAVENHYIDPNAVTLSISVFREKLMSFHDAQESDTTEPHKIALFQHAMSKITEGTSSEHYKNASMSEYNFNEILEYLIKHLNHVHAPMIMAAVMQPDKPCYRFQSGNCTREKCPFAHRKMTEQEMKDSNYDTNKLPKTINKSKGKSRNHEKNTFRNNNSEGTNGMHNNKNINNSDNNNNNAHPIKNYNKFNRQHRLLLALHDPQNGNTNQSNSFVNTGYNNNNQNNYNNLQYQNNGSHNNNKGGDFASWANGSTYTPTAHNGIHSNTMCMLQSIDDINID